MDAEIPAGPAESQDKRRAKGRSRAEEARGGGEGGGGGSAPPGRGSPGAFAGNRTGGSPDIIFPPSGVQAGPMESGVRNERTLDQVLSLAARLRPGELKALVSLTE